MRVLPAVMLLAAAGGCGTETESGRPLSPDIRPTANAALEYTVVKVPASLGGTQSRGMAINDARARRRLVQHE